MLHANTAKLIDSMLDNMCENMVEREKIKVQIESLKRINAELLKENTQLRHDLRKWKPRRNFPPPTGMEMVKT